MMVTHKCRARNVRPGGRTSPRTILRWYRESQSFLFDVSRRSQTQAIRVLDLASV